MGRYTRLCLQYFFDDIARNRWVSLGCLYLYFFRSTMLLNLSLHYNLLHFVVAAQLNLKCLLALGATQHAHLALIAKHREAHLHRIFALQLHTEFSFQVAHRYFTLRSNHNRSQLDGVSVLVGHLSLQRKRLSHSVASIQQAQEQ